MELLLSLPILFMISWYLTKKYISFAFKHKLIDVPNDRSAHLVITPRGGGIVFIGLWLLFTLGFFLFVHMKAVSLWAFVILAFIIALVSFLDDKRPLPPLVRASVHLFVAIIFVLALGGFNQVGLGFTELNLGILGSIIAILLIVWSINLFNFMDGTDGLAAMEAIFIFAMGGFMLWQADGLDLAILSWALAAGVAGFLRWNWPKAHVFMGDAGSTVLGFAVVAMGIMGQQWYGVSICLWFILYSMFLVDASLTLLRRVIAGEKWYAPHRLHAYQRLYQYGWTHAKVLWGLVLNNILLVCWALVGYYFQQLILPMFCLSLIQCLACYWLIEKYKPMYHKQPKI